MNRIPAHLSPQERLEVLHKLESKLELLLDTPIHETGGGVKYVLLEQIPAQYRHEFEEMILAAIAPSEGTTYLNDFLNWLTLIKYQVQAFRVPTLDEQPIHLLRNWNFVRHFSSDVWRLRGLTPEGKIRTTSAVKSFDLKHLAVLTESGRLYYLQGAPLRYEIDINTSINPNELYWITGI